MQTKYAQERHFLPGISKKCKGPSGNNKQGNPMNPSSTEFSLALWRSYASLGDTHATGVEASDAASSKSALK
jgi:hypothetical protein